MELKHVFRTNGEKLKSRLNRTFYGIETRYRYQYFYRLFVLIVPFMELKQIEREEVLIWRQS